MFRQILVIDDLAPRNAYIFDLESNKWVDGGIGLEESYFATSVQLHETFLTVGGWPEFVVGPGPDVPVKDYIYRY